mmetsp:Transcript_43035/g.113041  ORF Transcript_43035/g.113041 Transcript_43035/m.113041 type:complete len:349 (+) Transcript_43035:3-1049(+)
MVLCCRRVEHSGSLEVVQIADMKADTLEGSRASVATKALETMTSDANDLRWHAQAEPPICEEASLPDSVMKNARPDTPPDTPPDFPTGGGLATPSPSHHRHERSSKRASHSGSICAFHAAHGFSEADSPSNNLPVWPQRQSSRSSGFSSRISSRISLGLRARSSTANAEKCTSPNVSAASMVVLIIRQRRVLRKFQKYAENKKASRLATASDGDMDFTGVWKLVESVNFDEYLKCAGVSYVKRKLAAKFAPVQTWERQLDGTWQFSVNAPWGVKIEKFPIGEALEEDLFDSKFTKTSSLDGSTLLTEVREIGGSSPRDTTLKRYLKDGRLVLEMKLGEVVCFRIFARQ